VRPPRKPLGSTIRPGGFDRKKSKRKDNMLELFAKFALKYKEPDPENARGEARRTMILENSLRILFLARLVDEKKRIK
jgi:hypothetical protein